MGLQEIFLLKTSAWSWWIWGWREWWERTQTEKLQAENSLRDSSSNAASLQVANTKTNLKTSLPTYGMIWQTLMYVNVLFFTAYIRLQLLLSSCKMLTKQCWHRLPTLCTYNMTCNKTASHTVQTTVHTTAWEELQAYSRLMHLLFLQLSSSLLYSLYPSIRKKKTNLKQTKFWQGHIKCSWKKKRK